MEYDVFGPRSPDLALDGRTVATVVLRLGWLRSLLLFAAGLVATSTGLSMTVPASATAAGLGVAVLGLLLAAIGAAVALAALASLTHSSLTETSLFASSPARRPFL